MINSSLKLRCTPRPWHPGHAPRGLLKENIRGLISGRKAPWVGHANSSEYGVTVPGSVSLDLGLSTFVESCIPLKDSIATAPPPSRNPASTASVRRCLFVFERRRRSSRTSIL